MKNKFKKTKILFIDDDDDFREACSSILEDAGHEVVALNDSSTLAEHLNNKHFDIVLIDYFLKKESGTDVVKTFSKYKLAKNLPVIMISSHDDIKREVKKAGIKCFISKPLDFDELILKINEMLA